MLDGVCSEFELAEKRADLTLFFSQRIIIDGELKRPPTACAQINLFALALHNLNVLIFT